MNRIRLVGISASAALLIAVGVAASPTPHASVQASAGNSIDVAELTKAAGTLPEQSFPAI